MSCCLDKSVRGSEVVCDHQSLSWDAFEILLVSLNWSQPLYGVTWAAMGQVAPAWAWQWPEWGSQPCGREGSLSSPSFLHQRLMFWAARSVRGERQAWGGKIIIPSTFLSSGWFNNQIDMRPMNRRKLLNLSCIYVWGLHETLKLRTHWAVKT